ncbi:MAG: hypothetical protein LAQ69_40485 [Acidobacteriia bacterium]|nr:hypothetical protein [Terriglobia bacterium]
MTPDGKSNFDTLMSLADFHFRSWDLRREREQWKLTLALWGLLGAATAFLPPSIGFYQWYVGGLFLSLLYGRWLVGLLKAYRRDRDREQLAIDSAIQYVEQAFGQKNWELYKGHQDQVWKVRETQKSLIRLLCHWSVLPMWAITLMLIVVGPFIAHSRQSNEIAKQAADIRAGLESLKLAGSDQARIERIEQTLSELKATPPDSRTRRLPIRPK